MELIRRQSIIPTCHAINILTCYRLVILFAEDDMYCWYLARQN
jgi:hypothetical protein